MTLVLHDKKEIIVKGERTSKSCKPVFCITTGEIFASGLDAAEAIGAYPADLSRHLNGKHKTIKGKRFCFVADVADHIDEIAEMIHVASEKEAKRKAQELLAQRRAEYEEKRKALEEAERLLREAEANVKEE